MISLERVHNENNPKQEYVIPNEKLIVKIKFLAYT